MSYQQVRPTGAVHKLNEYIPTYQPHSDYLPTNRVLDANQPEAQKWVRSDLFSWQTTSNRREQVRSMLNAQLNSTLLVMFLYVLMRTSSSMHPFLRLSSTAESKEYDWIAIIILIASQASELPFYYLF